MKVDIKTRLNLEKLDLSIASYKNAINFSQDTYLIMNQDTMQEIKMLCKYECNKDNNISSSYKGIKIAICNDLEYGVVDIR